ncbi:hypothetical protein ACKLNQ_15980 [Myroides odoratimimus]|uniref:hypothetical protein n=1 Tax=Myroides odoratimimus TaxID=76832 RepID=UPI0038D3E135
MKNYTYFQLIAFFYNNILMHISQGETHEQALARAFDDFFYEEIEDNFLENFIVLINSIKVDAMFHYTISRMGVDIFLKYLTIYETISIEDYLNKEEEEHFLEVLNEVKHYLKKYME